MLISNYVPFKSAFAESSIELPSGFEVLKVVSALKNPTDIVFSPDGRWFFAERSGKVRVFEDGKLLSNPLLDISSHVNGYTDRGLLSIALDPDFETNGYIYLLYTYHRDGQDPTAPETNRLTRVQLSPPTTNTLTPTIDPPETIILGTISTPYDQGQDDTCRAGTDCITNDAGNHAADHILFLPDKTMLVSIGDGSSIAGPDKRALRSQDKNWMVGKVLRIDREGKGLDTNPFWNGDPDAPISKVYHYGLRNPFRMTLHPQFGLFIADVGFNRWEELNHATTPGTNFGWPCFEGNFVREGYSSNSTTKPECDLLYAHPETVTMPLFAYPHNYLDAGAAIIGGAFYFGNDYPLEYNGNYFFADLLNGYMKRILLDSSGKFVSSEDFAKGIPLGTTKVFTFPDGDLGWLSFYTGEVFKISYTAGNRPPVAVASSDISYGKQLPLEVQFSAQDSFDPDGGQISYLWDFGDSTGASSTERDPKYQFSEARKYVVTLTVQDDKSSSSSQIPIFAGNTPPTAEITELSQTQGTGNPSSKLVFEEGAHISYKGRSIDAEDSGGIAEGRVNWTLTLHHGDHQHIIFEDRTGYEGDFVAKYYYHTDDMNSQMGILSVIDEYENSYYELQFTATDSQGLSSSTSTRFEVLPSASPYDYAPNFLLLGGNYYEASEAPPFLPKFTVTAWFKTSKDYNSTANIVDKASISRAGEGYDKEYGIWMTRTEEIQAGFRDNGTNYYVQSPEKYSDGRWHYAVTTYDGADLILYIDGSEVASKHAVVIRDSGGDEPLRIGAKSERFVDFFSGRVDEIRIWDRAISAADVADQYNNGNFDLTGQVAFFSFDSHAQGSLSVIAGMLEPYGARASIFNGQITDSVLEPDSNGILLRVKTDGDAEMTILLPRTLIDAKDGDSDASFIVTIGGKEIKYRESNISQFDRILVIPIPAGSEEVRIAGTQVIPELPSASILVIIAIMTSMAIIMYRKLHFRWSGV